MPTPTPTPSPGPCVDSNILVTTNADSGPGSLRQAIMDVCAGGTINFDMSRVASPIVLTSSAIAINRAVTIRGPGLDRLAITTDNTNGFGIFQSAVPSPGVVNVSGLTIAQGAIGLTSNGGLNVASCAFLNNRCTTAGAAIFSPSDAVITATYCTFDGNNSPGSGGAIFVSSGRLTVRACAFSNNSAFFLGSGGAIASGGTALIADSTITANSAISLGNDGGGGGGIENAGAMTVVNCTITNNSTSHHGGGIQSYSGVIQLQNTIVALNSSTAQSREPDVSGSFTSLGHNLIGETDGSTGFAAGTNHDLAGTIAAPLDPGLSSDGLQNNGGPTPTIALQPSSPAIDAGDDTVLFPPVNLETDQRGFARSSNRHVDLGAYEFQFTNRPQITQTDVVGADFVVKFLASAGLTYRLERSDDLSASNWQSNPEVSDYHATSDQPAELADPQAAAAGAAFYRIRLVP